MQVAAVPGKNGHNEHHKTPEDGVLEGVGALLQGLVMRALEQEGELLLTGAFVPRVGLPAFASPPSLG
jgi:hypothetical protein